MLVIIDNYDSFTYNLVQYFGELQTEAEVFRNDQIGIDELESLKPKYLVISPGPCTPKESGISVEAIRRFSGKIPILGVCLGHQCIGEVFGGRVIRAPYPVHGKMSLIYHNSRELFQNIPQPFEAVRYHSLVVERDALPKTLEITATTEDGLIMGLKHIRHPTYGVQFHPESIFTGVGKDLLANFLKINQSQEEENLIIKTAQISDAAEILSLQKTAYQSEAVLYNDFNIPPLLQTQPELEQELAEQVVLKAVGGNKIIGSVRAYQKDGTCYIGKLIVAPDRQNQGIGTRLIQEVETVFPDCTRFELFTGFRSDKNLYLYQKLGFKIFKTEKVSDQLSMVFLEKQKV